jgi:aspartate/methionine/tyrosine aminotransferase
MTSEEANKEKPALFDAEDYTTWCRQLYRHVPRDGSAHILFDSTISEPTELLRGAVARTFGVTVSDRFVSVFGQGNTYLIDALAKRYGVGPDQVVCATGATNAISMALRVLPPERRRVLVETPRLDLLHHLPSALGLDIVEFTRRAPAFDVDPDDIEREMKGDVGMIVLTNPHNPSGAILSGDRLKDIAEIAARAGVLVLVDEVYSELAVDGGFIGAVQIAPNMISLNSLSKSYGLFSLRCGWILAEPQIARRIEAANARTEFGASKLTHAIAAHVLEEIEPFDAYWRSVLAANRPILDRHVASMKRDGLIDGDAPSTGCMYFPRLLSAADTSALARAIWEEHQVLVAPGEYFGCPGHVRLGFGAADQRLDAGLAHLHEALRAKARGAARGSVRPQQRANAS